MKTRTALLRSIGVLLALLVFTALPNSVLATCSPCHNPTLEWVYGPGNQLYVEMECDCPPGATIFYTINAGNPAHSGATPIPPTLVAPSGSLVAIPSGFTGCIRALASKSGSTDSGVSVLCQHGPE